MKDNYIKKLLICIVIFRFCNILGQSQYNTTLVGEWEIGNYGMVKINNNIVYYANGTYLETVDLSNPNHPIELGRIVLKYQVKNIDFKGKYAYVATKKNISIVDISNPAKPVMINEMNNIYPESVVINSDHAFVAQGGSMIVLDISNPTVPIEIGHLIIKDTFAWYPVNLTIQGNFAYVLDISSNLGGLHIIDISDPTKPAEVGHLSISFGSVGLNYLHEIVIKGNFAYAGCGDKGLCVIDISNPQNPVLISTIITGGATLGIDSSGNYLYVSSVLGGLGVVDISNPSQPTFLGNFGLNMNGRGLAVWGSYCYMADAIYGLVIYDINNQAVPKAIMYLIPYGYGIDISGDYAYIASGHSGLHLFNISDPANISKAGYYYYGSEGQTNDVKVSGNYAYVANGWGGLSILDISSPSKPIEVGHFKSSNAYGIAIRDNFVYLTDGDQCLLKIIDISNPQTPSETGQLKLKSNFLTDVFIKDSYAYIAADSAGIYIVDISNPTSPKEVGFLNTEGNAYQIATNGNYIYVADGGSFTGKPHGLSIIDISNPSKPFEVGRMYNNSFIRGVSTKGNFLYVLGQNYSPWKMYIVDITNPYSPVEKGYFFGESTNEFISTASQVYIKDNYAYVASTNGLYIIRNDLLTDTKNEEYQVNNYKLDQNYPNPFNPTTTINYSIPQASFVTIKVYDVLGHEITTLVNGEKPAGNYEVKFSVETRRGESLPSGIYFYSLQAGSYYAVKKLVVLK